VAKSPLETCLAGDCYSGPLSDAAAYRSFELLRTMADHSKELVRLLRKSVLSGGLQKAVFSSPKQPAEPVRRIEVRPVEIREAKRFQFSSQTETQQTHRNLDANEAIAAFDSLCRGDYRNVRVVMNSEISEARMSKKGVWFLKTTATSLTMPEKTAGTHGPGTRNRTIEFEII
jgi:hypothetical protein